MRAMLIIAAGALAAAACASPGETVTSTAYEAELARLKATCEARNGFLWPLNRRTGLAATDYECRYMGGTNPYALRP